jgi:hypothetical protein
VFHELVIELLRTCNVLGGLYGTSDSAERAATMREVEDLRMDEWLDWQRGVVKELRAELGEHLGELDDHDIDWEAWLPLYLEGCTPKAAVEKAFVRH